MFGLLNEIASENERLHKAYALRQLWLVKRIHAHLYILENRDVAEVAKMLNLSPQSIYQHVKAFIINQLVSLTYPPCHLHPSTNCPSLKRKT
jgi:hypothetical protein